MDSSTGRASWAARANAAVFQGSHSTAGAPLGTSFRFQLVSEVYNALMLVLRYVTLLALVMWVGGLFALGAFAAPATFDVMAIRQIPDGRMLAGAVFGEILRRFFLASCGAAVVVLGSLTLRRILGPKPRHFGLRAGLLILMAAATTYAGVVVAGRIAVLQSTLTVAPSSLPETDARRIEFGRLHVLSTSLQLVPLLGGLVLLFWELKE